MQTAYVEIGGQARTALVGGPSQLSRLQAFKLILQGRAETHYHVATISSEIESAKKDLVLAFFQLYNTLATKMPVFPHSRVFVGQTKVVDITGPHIQILDKSFVSFAPFN